MLITLLKAHVDLPLAKNIDKYQKISAKEHFLTTNQEYHNFKDNSDPLKQEPVHAKAPSLTKVNYLNEFRFVTNKRPWKRSLSPRNQRSETHDEFSALPQLPQPRDLLGIKNFLLHEYDAFDNCEVIRQFLSILKHTIAENIEDKWEGGKTLRTDAELLRNLDPYLTTNQKNHRAWKLEELKDYSKKDILTHWDTCNIGKLPGTGLKEK